MLFVVGLGPGGYDLVTLRAARLIESADRLFLRTAVHPAVSELPAGVQWTSFDHLYEQAASFEQVYQTIVDEMLARAAEAERVVYAVPGDPAFGEETVSLLVRRAPEAGVEVRLVPSVSYLSPVVAAAVGSAPGHLQVLDATAPVEPNPLQPSLFYQVYSRAVASDLKLELLRILPAEHEVALVRGPDPSAPGAVERVPLAELDRARTFDHLTSLYVPSATIERAAGSHFGLRGLVARLRRPGGCPWDRKQTHRSLTRFALEEAYEVVEAIESDDPHALREELGDLLLQVYLHAEIAEEAGDFDLNDVMRTLAEKLIRRHPHVFGDWAADDARQVEVNWEKLKQMEKGDRPDSAFDDIPVALPALARAQRLQRRLRSVGFDWPDPRGAWDKLFEEIAELKAEADNRERLASELGDVLFMLARVAAQSGVDAEESLRQAIQRVTTRIKAVEMETKAAGRSLDELTAKEWLAGWERAKRADQASS